MGKKTKLEPIGRTLINARQNLPSAKRKKNKLDSLRQEAGCINSVVEQEADNAKAKNLASITEQNDLDEFMARALLAGTEFVAQRMNVSMVEAGSNKVVGVVTDERDDLEKKALQEKYKHYLTVPRRPDWNRKMSAEELHELENQSFLQWRRKLAELEELETLVLTPFERNIEIWRQLWRVVDKSQLVVQILDARDPLLFRNEDLEQYVGEVASKSHLSTSTSTLSSKNDENRKLNLLILNKADHLTEKQRKIWCDYFTERKVRIVFWSALDPEEENKEKLTETVIKEGSEENLEDEEESCSNADKEAKPENDEESCENADDDEEYSTVDDEEEEEKVEQVVATSTELNSPKVLNRLELLEYFTMMKNEICKETNDVFTIGMVGYPNVGKSSTINKLLQNKKVAVSATPGKTKHFQTLFLDDQLLLCDCPGLVMPSFGMSKQQMTLSGILSTDQMRQYEAPVALMCQKVPRRVFQKVYGLTFPRRGGEEAQSAFGTDARELLTLHAFSRGFMSPKGLPDCSRAARALVKDFIGGKIRYCHAPPGIDQTDFNDWSHVDAVTTTSSSDHRKDGATASAFSETLRTLQKRHLVDNEGGKTSEVDMAFFQSGVAAMHVKRAVGKAATTGMKPPKKANRNQKRDKLRRVYRDLDA